MTEPTDKATRARSLRHTETKTEKLLWSVLRARQVCGLKFRRQHPIGPFFADFACVSHKLVIEIDGGYHEAIEGSDRRREAFLKHEGWNVFRCSDRDVEDDPESIAVAIAKQLGLTYAYKKRAGGGCGMESRRAPNKRRKEPSPAAGASDPPAPAGGCLG